MKAYRITENGTEIGLLIISEDQKSEVISTLRNIKNKKNCLPLSERISQASKTRGWKWIPEEVVKDIEMEE